MGRAAQIYSKLRSKHRKEAGKALRVLRKRLVPTETEYLALFESRAPHKNETTREYAESLAELYDKANRQASSSQRNRDLRRQLKKYLPESLQALLPIVTSETWERSVETVAGEIPVLNAVDDGENLSSPTRFKSNRVAFASDQRQTKAAPRQWQQQQTQYEQQRAAEMPQQLSRLQPQPQPQNQHQQQPPPPSSRQSDQPRQAGKRPPGVVICMRCQGEGHYGRPFLATERRPVDFAELNSPSSSDFISSIKATRAMIEQAALKRLEKARRHQERQAKRRETGAREIAIGDSVLVSNEATHMGSTKKLEALYTGPYEVIGKRGPVDLVVAVKGKPKTIHRNRLKLYESSSSVRQPFVRLPSSAPRRLNSGKRVLEKQPPTRQWTPGFRLATDPAARVSRYGRPIRPPTRQL